LIKPVANDLMDVEYNKVVETITFGEDELLELPAIGNLMVGHEGEDMDVDMDMDEDEPRGEDFGHR